VRLTDRAIPTLALSALWLLLPAGVPAARAGAGDLAAIPWGAPEAVVRSQVEVDACVAGRAPDERVCSAAWSIAREPARAYFWLVADRLVQVNIAVPSRSFGILVKTIDARLGAHSSVRLERVTRGAVTFTNEIREWRAGPVAATVSRYEVGYGGDSQASLRLVEPAVPVRVPASLRTP
jgi:hypothetical protein